MYDQKHSVAPIGIFGICAALLFTQDSAAAAPLYFDLGGLILYGSMYLLGLIVLPLLIVLSKESSHKRFLSWTFVAYIVVPVALVSSVRLFNNIRNERILEETRNREIQNREAFGKYCKDGKRIIYSRAQHSNDASLVVHIEKNFNGNKVQFNAFQLFNFMRKNILLCQITGLRSLEGIYDGKYSAEKKGYEKEIRRYICTNEKWLVDSEIQSRYELRLGETGRKVPAPSGKGGGHWMADSSIRIVDRSTGQTLAEDTM